MTPAITGPGGGRNSLGWRGWHQWRTYQTKISTPNIPRVEVRKRIFTPKKGKVMLLTNTANFQEICGAKNLHTISETVSCWPLLLVLSLVMGTSVGVIQLQRPSCDSTQVKFGLHRYFKPEICLVSRYSSFNFTAYIHVYIYTYIYIYIYLRRKTT